MQPLESTCKPRRKDVLPTSRAIYIKQHPVTQTAALQTSDHLIAPIWGRVTATPW
jgi:hypothetical protein